MSSSSIGSKDQVFERNNWSTNDGAVQSWVNDIIWSLVQGPRANLRAPSLIPVGMAEAANVCRMAIVHNNLQGMIPHVYGDALKDVLGAEFYDRIETDRRRTEIFSQELLWVFTPKMRGQIMAVESAAVRRVYDDIECAHGNPRFTPLLTLWAPTLSVRQDVETVLNEGGYLQNATRDGRTVFSKNTQGISHSVTIKSILWESSKNWSSDVERAIWDRAIAHGGEHDLKFDITDLFLLTLRHFAVDTLLGSGSALLDLVTLLEKAGDALEWGRLKEIKDRFTKPDWFWASLFAVALFEQKTGRRVQMPDWVRSTLNSMIDSFWYNFIESRLCWANPDSRLVEFSRAYVKLAKGT